VSISLQGDETGASIEGDAAVDVGDGQAATFKVTLGAGYGATVSHGSFSRDTGLWTIPSVHGDMAAIMTLKRQEAPALTAVLTIGSKTMLTAGQSVELEAAPYIKGGRTMLPLRAVVQVFGGDIAWDAAERKVTVKLGVQTVVLWIDKSSAAVDGTTTPIDADNTQVVPEIVNGRTMLPVRFVSESLGCSVQWVDATKTITITFGS
jgi:hypothetical protein